ncbi:uncharacterized protein LACBIDRAFT_314063 [Laccaria bicolor S238N-H82]|uniref:Predicted protein n=1 Tax=Laccaria bicolor (strain S238N-H82 / ATCC MYA-4686) TaxID=486041 RepID=B0D1H7_LACBS|nr:uncharacterized protein LACBIDRAFT_314063 [Laccaria bicolor S238N-H82]EDR11639.1 predicted protein [Laccaria bicolor S238N-H82]|eukprot:XP_001877536.1 predicted protein [Laccaria bicolor S238N-H82]
MLSSRPAQLSTDAPYFPTKTPGCGLKNRAENAIHPGAKTVLGGGKHLGTPLTIQPQRLFKDSTVTKTQLKPTVLATRPLADKTPFVNRARTYFNTPLGKGGKLFPQEEDGIGNGTPDSLQRPSSTRKHVRAPRSATKSFETPMNQGKHWDVSDGDIVVPVSQPQEILEDEDFDEIEYMPPNTLDLPYKPPIDFELPDYKVVGQTLRNLAYSVPFDPVSFDLEIPETNLEPASSNLPELDFLDDDDPFSQSKPSKPVAAKPMPSKVAARPVPVLKPMHARIPSAAFTTIAGPTLSRAATSTSMRTTTASKVGPSRPTTKLANPTTRTTPAVISKPIVRPVSTRNPAATTAAVASSPRAATLKRPLTSMTTYKSTATGTARPPGKAGITKPALESASIVKPATFELDQEDFLFDV